MAQWYRVNTAVLNIRDGAGAGNRDIGDLHFNDRIETEGTPVNGWLHITRIIPAGSNTPSPLDGWCSGAYCVAIAAPVVTPPPDPEPEPVDDPIVSGRLTLTRQSGATEEYTIGSFTRVS